MMVTSFLSSSYLVIITERWSEFVWGSHWEKCNQLLAVGSSVVSEGMASSPSFLSSLLCPAALLPPEASAAAAHSALRPADSLRCATASACVRNEDFSPQEDAPRGQNVFRWMEAWTREGGGRVHLRRGWTQTTKLEFLEESEPCCYITREIRLLGHWYMHIPEENILILAFAVCGIPVQGWSLGAEWI